MSHSRLLFITQLEKVTRVNWVKTLAVFVEVCPTPPTDGGRELIACCMRRCSRDIMVMIAISHFNVLSLFQLQEADSTSFHTEILLLGENGG